MKLRNGLRSLFAAIVIVSVGCWAVMVQRSATAQNPLPTITPLPSVTASPTVALGVPTGLPGPSATATSALLAATVTSSAPQSTPTSALLSASATPANNTPQPTVALVQSGGAPLLSFKFPQGWVYAFQRVSVRTGLSESFMNVAIYRGPLPKGTGTIIVLWGYPNTVAPPTSTPGSGTPTGVPGSGTDILSQMLWTDGLRLLQGAILDITCNVGTTGQRMFSVGNVQGIGTFYNVTGCQGEPETAGWFVGVNQYERNYLFYAYIEPVDAYNDARGDLQKILDTVQFIPPPTVTPTPAS